MSASYRQHFTDDGAAVAYDEGQYRPGSFWDSVWTLEQRELERIVQEQRSRTPNIEYLDFACGTARVLSFMESRVESATGIDVSPRMLERAAARVRRARLIQADVTRPDTPIEGHYDLVSAFRFVLNAEPGLRKDAVSALARRLRDRESRLVINTHGNPLSYKGLVVPARRMLGLRGAEENLLSVTALEALLESVGLEVVERSGMGVLPSPVWRLIPGAALAAEGALMRAPLVWRLGVNQLLVCRLARGAAEAR